MNADTLQEQVAELSVHRVDFRPIIRGYMQKLGLIGLINKAVPSEMEVEPGLIVAGSIVGSGELIATTATGAQAGFWLLWLILIGCVIKVFVQIELGRYSIVTGQTTMAGLNQVPGPVIDIQCSIVF